MFRSAANTAFLSIVNKNNKYLKGILVLVCCALTAFPVMGQIPSLPIDFDDAATVYDLQSFGGANAVLGFDPTDASNQVVAITKPPGSECFGGTTIGGGPTTCLDTAIPFAAGSTTITVDVFSPVAGAPILLKVEDCANGGISSEIIVLTTAANTWETLTFDLSMGCPSPVNFANVYDKITVFPNFTCTPDACGAVNPGAGSAFSTDPFYIDNIILLPPALELPLDFENTALDFGLTSFGGASGVLGVDPMDATNSVLCVTKPPGSECFGGTTIGGGTACLDTPISFAAGSTTISVDVFSPVAGAPILLKVEDCTNGGISSEIIVLTTAVNTWETLSFDLSMGCPNPVNFANTYNRITIFPNFTCTPDACGVPNPGAGSAFSNDAFYFDNIMLTTNPALPGITCTGNVPIENLANGMDYTITSDAAGNVDITVTVVDNPCLLYTSPSPRD